MAVFFALITLIGWGVGDLFMAISSRKIGSTNTLFWYLFLAFIATSFFLPWAWPIRDYSMIFLTAFLSLFQFGGTLVYYKGLEIGNASLVGAISGSFLVPVLLISLFIFGEKISTIQMTGISFVLTGLFLCLFQWKDLKTLNAKNILSEKGLIYALLAAFGWGIYFSFVKIPVSKIGWFWPTFIFNLMFIFLLRYSLMRKEVIKIKNNKMNVITIIIATILITIGLFAYNLGITKGFVSVVAPIAGAYPVLFVILSRFVFKEPLSKQQRIGIALTLMGIITISF